MTMSKEVTWYKNHYAVTWEDGTTEQVVTHSHGALDKPIMRPPRIYLKRRESSDAWTVGYIRPWIRSRKVKAEINLSVERVLNFEKIQSIDHIESEEIVEEVEVDG